MKTRLTFVLQSEHPRMCDQLRDDLPAHTAALFALLQHREEQGGRPAAPRAIFSITMFVIFCLLFLVQMFFHMFKVTSPNVNSFSRSDLAGHLADPVYAETNTSCGAGEFFRRVNRSAAGQGQDVCARRTQEL